jgi:hypothetical protein
MKVGAIENLVVAERVRHCPPGFIAGLDPLVRRIDVNRQVLVDPVVDALRQLGASAIL